MENPFRSKLNELNKVDLTLDVHRLVDMLVHLSHSIEEIGLQHLQKGSHFCRRNVST